MIAGAMLIIEYHFFSYVMPDALLCCRRRRCIFPAPRLDSHTFVNKMQLYGAPMPFWAFSADDDARLDMCAMELSVAMRRPRRRAERTFYHFAPGDDARPQPGSYGTADGWRA